MSDVQEMIEWAIDLLKNHPVSEYVGETRSWGFAVELARLRVELEIAMQESLAKIGEKPVSAYVFPDDEKSDAPRG